MDRVAVFVDAGYLFAQGSALITGAKTPRGHVKLDLDKVLTALESFASRISGVPLLRIYWYDGTSTGPGPEHIALAFKPNVKVRLGFVNTAGQQKGVDSLIVTDIITLARNRVMSDAVLLSGDEDVRVGVQQAQEFGVRVHLLGISPCRGSQSLFLLQEADTTHEWTQNDVSSFLTSTQRAQVAQPANPPPASQITAKPLPAIPRSMDELIAEVIKDIDVSLLDGLVKNYESLGQLPPTVDRPLVGRAGKAFGRLDQIQLKALRSNFVAAMKKKLASN
jgi:hypothetical protein